MKPLIISDLLLLCFTPLNPSFLVLLQLALYVLSYLEPKDLLRAAQTCRYWHVLCEDNLLWREKCREEGIDETLVYGSRLRRRPGLRSPCKALYMRQSQIEHNWRKGVSRIPKVVMGWKKRGVTVRHGSYGVQGKNATGGKGCRESRR